ncbi:hypothetical protein SNL152K_2859 [Streptomyces sp. NL15-2K]|nr:hypothetical protein SNL152K_2859 [Streptomyces sp. NL15-2K]
MKIAVRHLVENGSNLRHHAVPGHREPLSEVPVAHRHESHHQSVQGSRIHRGGPATRLALVTRGLSAFRARLSAPRRCARLHCVPPAGVDRYCCVGYYCSAYQLLLRIHARYIRPHQGAAAHRGRTTLSLPVPSPEACPVFHPA